MYFVKRAFYATRTYCSFFYSMFWKTVISAFSKVTKKGHCICFTADISNMTIIRLTPTLQAPRSIQTQTWPWCQLLPLNKHTPPSVMNSNPEQPAEGKPSSLRANGFPATQSNRMQMNHRVLNVTTTTGASKGYPGRRTFPQLQSRQSTAGRDVCPDV